MVVRKSCHALGEHIAAEAQLQGDAGGSEAGFQVSIQVAHVAQALWLQVQDFARLLWVEHLHRG